MKRMNTVGRTLAFTAMLAALPLALSAQTTYHVDINAAGPGDGTPGDPFPTVQAAIDELIASGSDGDTIYIHPGVYPPTGSFQTNAQHTGAGTQRTHTNITALFNGLILNDITITGDPNDRPIFDGGIFFANDTHTGFTMENIIVRGRTTTDNEIAYLVNSFNQTGATVSGVPNVGRRDMTIRNCEFDGQNIGIHAGSPLTSTQGLRIYQLGGDFTFEDNVITRLTGNVAFSPTGAGSVHANDYNADPPRVPSTVYIRRNQMIASTGAIDVRGFTNSNSFLSTSKNPIMYVTDNIVSGVPPSPAPSGGAFKIFHAKEGYFYGNKISATAVTGNAYGDDPCNPGLDNRVRGAGIMFLNVGKLIIAGNEFIDCLQAICHDPHPAAGATSSRGNNRSVDNQLGPSRRIPDHL